jgi:quinol monooxygenase YgiN
MAAVLILEITIKVFPQKQGEFMQTINSLIAQIRKEKGCLRYDCHNLKDRENDFSIVEEWETQEYLDRHMESEIFGILSGAMKTMGKSWKIMIRTDSGTRVIEDVKRICT